VTQELVDQVKHWHHSIRVGDGVVTPGGKTLEHHHDDLKRLRLPELAGKSVLDIGAWDGYYTFMAEGAGASRVVALDHYAWSVDFERAADYTSRQLRDRQPIRPFHTRPEIWDPVGLPGKRGFDLVYQLLHSRAEVVVGDFMTIDPAAVGTFDVVLFMGVIYHVEEPLTALRRVREFTRGVAAIETEAVVLPAAEGRPLWQFIDAAKVNQDPTVLWVPTAEGLQAM
jgi:tRNA (mo5U34)-methyltransferase